MAENDFAAEKFDPRREIQRLLGQMRRERRKKLREEAGPRRTPTGKRRFSR
jgi:hypothetical protein